MLRLSLLGLVLVQLIYAGSAQELTSQAQQKINQILSEMTLEEKAAQMILVYHSPEKFLKEHQFGGVLIMQNMLKHPGQLTLELQSIQKNMKIPLIISVDQEGGKVNRLKTVAGFEKATSAKQLARWPTDSITAYTAKQAAVLKSMLINTNLAPVLDPTVDHLGQATFMDARERAFGKSSSEILQPAFAFAQGFSAHNILCVTKHFPGYDVQTNSDHQIAVSMADSLTIEKYAEVFHAFATQAGGVMMSSIHYPKFSPYPSVFSPALITLARRENKDLVVMTDDLWGTALRAWVSQTEDVSNTHYSDKDFEKLTLFALRAGNDMLMITYPAKAILMKNTIVKEMQKNPDMVTQVNDSVRRILLLKFKLGLIN